MKLRISEDVDDSTKDLAEQILETFLSDVNELKGIYLSYRKLYVENKDNNEVLFKIADNLSSIVIDIPEFLKKNK